MSKKHSVFFDDWKACLHAHYEHVVHSGDTITEPTLRQVLQQTGIPDEELIAIQAAAVMLPDAASGDDMAADDTIAEVIEDVFDQVDVEPGELEDDESFEIEDVFDQADMEQGELEDDESFEIEDAPEDDLPDEIDADAPDDSPPPPAQLSLF